MSDAYETASTAKDGTSRASATTVAAASSAAAGGGGGRGGGCVVSARERRRRRNRRTSRLPFFLLPAIVVVLLLSLVLPSPVASLHFHPLHFSDGMVLQRAPSRSRIYGSLEKPPTARKPPQITVTVTPLSDPSGTYTLLLTSDDGTVDETTGNFGTLLRPHGPDEGEFAISLLCSKYCGENDEKPRSAAIYGVLFGDVWFCSGQNNMALPLLYTFTRERTVKALKEGKYGRIRIMSAEGNMSWEQKWSSALDIIEGSEGGVDDFYKFSSTCWYFAEALTDRLGGGLNDEGEDTSLPIGLIHVSYASSKVEDWVDDDTLAKCDDVLPRYSKQKEGWDASRVEPFTKMTIKGWLWYQGELDVQGTFGTYAEGGGGTGYACLFPALVSSWRSKWSVDANTTSPDAPFGFVTLPPSGGQSYPDVGAFRLAQTAGYGVVPNPALPRAFLAQGYDLDDPYPDRTCYDRGCCTATDELEGGSVVAFAYEKTPPPMPCTADDCSTVCPLCKPYCEALRNTTFFMSPMHPRSKREVGERLAQAAAVQVYGGGIGGGGTVEGGEAATNNNDGGGGGGGGAYTGPTIAGCKVRPEGVLTIQFDRTLLKDDVLRVSDYRNESLGLGTSKMEVLLDSSSFCLQRKKKADGTGMTCISDGTAGKKEPFDLPPDADMWTEVDIGVRSSFELDVDLYTKTVAPPFALRYAWDGPCCDLSKADGGYCPTASCPITGSESNLPANPFLVLVTEKDGCICFPPQKCGAFDEEASGKVPATFPRAPAVPATAPPTAAPTGAPVTAAPTKQPATDAPVTPAPTGAPVTHPTTAAPVTSAPTGAPVTRPTTDAPATPAPTGAPVAAPTTSAPVTGQPVSAAPVTTPTAAAAAAAASAGGGGEEQSQPKSPPEPAASAPPPPPPSPSASSVDRSPPGTVDIGPTPSIAAAVLARNDGDNNNAHSSVRFSPLLGNDMVLQAEPYKSAVFGTVDAKKPKKGGGAGGGGGDGGANKVVEATVKVTVSDGGGGRNAGKVLYSVSATVTGSTFKAYLRPTAAGTVLSITAECTSGCPPGKISSSTLSNVLFGDVWFCAGSSNMAAHLQYTLSRNDTVKRVREGAYDDYIRIFSLESNSNFAQPWSKPSEAHKEGTFLKYSGTCWYFAEALVERLKSGGGRVGGVLGRGGKVPPLGLVHVSSARSRIEDWMDDDAIDRCHDVPVRGSSNDAAAGLFDSRVKPFADSVTVRGFLWYGGDTDYYTDYPSTTGTIVFGSYARKSGYACLQVEMIRSWRTAFGKVEGTTDRAAPFGIVTLTPTIGAVVAGGPGVTGWQRKREDAGTMRWAQTGGYGVVPNAAMKNAFQAQGYDLIDPHPYPNACYDTGCCRPDLKFAYSSPQDGPGKMCLGGDHDDERCRDVCKSCDNYCASLDGTNFFGGPAQSRNKRAIGERLARAAASEVYGTGGGSAGSSSLPVTGPVIAGCRKVPFRQSLVIRFHKGLLAGDIVDVRDYRRLGDDDDVDGGGGGSASAVPSRVEVLVDPDHFCVQRSRSDPTKCVDDGYGHTGKQAVDPAMWVPVDVTSEEGGRNELTVDLSRTGGTAHAIRYAWGDDGVACCPQQDETSGEPCDPESCAPIFGRTSGLPANPFVAKITRLGTCECLHPQTCHMFDEHAPKWHDPLTARGWTFLAALSGAVLLALLGMWRLRLRALQDEAEYEEIEKLTDERARFLTEGFAEVSQEEEEEHEEDYEDCAEEETNSLSKSLSNGAYEPYKDNFHQEGVEDDDFGVW